MAECRKHQAEHGRGNKKTGCVLVEPYPYIVKYGDPETLASYTVTQSFLYSQSNKLRIPKLIHQFDNGQGTSYVVLEHIKLVESPDDLDERIVDAVKWLLGVQAPSDHQLGPLGGGCIRHAFFESSEAPLPFVSVTALQRYVDKGRTRLINSGKSFDRVKLTEERLVCVQARLDASHFGVDEEDNTVLMGLGNISFLPESFATYTLLSNAKFATLPETLGLSGDTNMKAMVAIAHNLGMTSDPSLGLDKYGRTPNKGTKDTASDDL